MSKKTKWGEGEIDWFKAFKEEARKGGYYTQEEVDQFLVQQLKIHDEAFGPPVRLRQEKVIDKGTFSSSTSSSQPTNIKFSYPQKIDVQLAQGTGTMDKVKCNVLSLNDHLAMLNEKIHGCQNSSAPAYIQPQLYVGPLVDVDKLAGWGRPSNQPAYYKEFPELSGQASGNNMD